MRSLSQPFLRRPVFTVVCSLLILLAGLVALTGLGLEDLPQLAPTRVSVRATFAAASPEVVDLNCHWFKLGYLEGKKIMPTRTIVRASK